jgi:hypothetical protein
MAQTLLSGNISAIYDKLIFTKGDGKLYYTDTSGDTDVEFTQVTLDTELAAWAGTTNITTLGTIGTGTWNATEIAVNKGGTGQTSYTDGQLLIGNSSGNTLSKATLSGTSNEIEITNGSGTITIGIPNAPTLTGNTTVNGKIIMQNGATIDNSSAGNKLLFDVEDIYGFKTSDSVGDLVIELIADGGGSAVDINRLRSADGGTIYFDNYEGSSWSTSMSIDKNGKLVLGGNIIRNSDNEDVLTVTADQKLIIASNIIQNTDAEDVITMDAAQDVTFSNDVIINGDQLKFTNSGGNPITFTTSGGTNLLNITTAGITFGSSSSTAYLLIYGAPGLDAAIKYYEGATGKWVVGNDGTTDSFVWATGSAALGSGNDKLELAQDGALTVIGDSSGPAVLNLNADQNAANSKKFAIETTSAGIMRFKNKISGLHQTYLTLTPHISVANSTFDVGGTAQATAVKTDTISEKTADNGVLIEGITLKDNALTTNNKVTASLGNFPKQIAGNMNYTRIRPLEDGKEYVGPFFSASGTLTAAKITGVGLTAYDIESPHTCTLKSVSASVYFSTAGVYTLRIYKGTVTDADTAYDSLSQVGSDITFNSSSAVNNNTFYRQVVTVNESLTIGDKIFSAWSVDPDPGSPTLYCKLLYNLTA